MYSFVPSTSQDCAEMRGEYLRSLIAPKDGMWEAFIDMGSFFIIKKNDNEIGYLVLNHDRYLLQFTVNEEAESAFASAIENLGIVGSFVATCETEFMCLSLDHQQSVSINALMYHTPKQIELTGIGFNDNSVFRVLNQSDFEDAVALAMEALSAGKNWLRGYYAERIEKGELYGLLHGANLIAAGECRQSQLQDGIVDLGMVVAPTQRRKGIATNLLVKLLELCSENDWIPICSTEQDNLGAQKSITKAGFVAYHRILEVKF